jgi:predicted nucleotide-binding protein
MHQDVPFGKLPGFDKEDFNSLKEGIKISYILFTRKKTEIALWILEKSSKFKGEKKYLRFLRRHILRLHSEWECFKDIDGLIKTGKIKEVLRDKANEKLKRYIFDVNELLLNPNHDKMPKKQDEYEVLKEAMNYLKKANEVKINCLISRREFFLKKDLGSKNMNTNLSKTKNEVFIVHGHDKEKVYETERFLNKLKLNPKILHEQPSEGRTIIEKFENYSNVDFAVVLLTPDDKGGKKTTDYKEQRPRSRQNVIFELGYFIGKLGRNRVCVLYIPEVEILSDYDGVVNIKFDNDGAWRMHLAREMKKAGLHFDMDDALGS